MQTRVPGSWPAASSQPDVGAIGAQLSFLQPLHPPRASRSDVSHWPGARSTATTPPGYRGPAPRPRQGSQIRRPGRGLAPLAGCLSPRLSPGVSLSLNPRLMAGKPPACKIDATSPQETQLHPRDRKRRAYVAQTGSLLPCRRRVAGQGVGDPFALETSTPCGLPTRDTADRQLRYECPPLRLAPFFRPDVGGCRRM